MDSSSDEDVRKKGGWLLVNRKGSVENSDEESTRSKSPTTNVAGASEGAVIESTPDKDVPRLDPLQTVPDERPTSASSESWSSSGSTLVSNLPSPQPDQETTPPLDRVEEDLSCVSNILKAKIEKEDSHSLDSFEVLSEGPSVEGGLSLNGQSEDMFDEEDGDNDCEFPAAQEVPPRFTSDSDSDFVRLSEPTASTPSGVEELGEELQSPLSHDPDSSSPESDHADQHSAPYGGSCSSGEDSETRPIMPPRPQNAPYQDVRGCPSEEESDHIRIMSRRWPTEDGGFLLVQRFKKLDPDAISMMSSSMSDVSGFSMLGGSSHQGMLSDTQEEEEGGEGSDTDSEASDSSFASEETLPVNMTVGNLPPALRQYLHQRNDVFNSKLSLLAILVLTAGLTLGIGHFVGSSQMVNHHKSLQEGQKFRLRSLQDELVSCMEKRKAAAKQLQERDLEYQECNRAREEAVLQSLPNPEGFQKEGLPMECMDSVDVKVCNHCQGSELRYSKFCNTLCPLDDGEHGPSCANVEKLGSTLVQLGSGGSQMEGKEQNGKSVITDDIAHVETVAPELEGELPKHGLPGQGEEKGHHGDDIVLDVLDDGSIPVEEYYNRGATMVMTEYAVTPKNLKEQVISKYIEETAKTPEECQNQDIPIDSAEETSTPVRHHIRGVAAEDARTATENSLDAHVGNNPPQDEDKWACAYHDHGTLECVSWFQVNGEFTDQQRDLDGGHPGETDPSTMEAHSSEADQENDVENTLQHLKENMEVGTYLEIPLQTVDPENQENMEQDPQGENDGKETLTGFAQGEVEADFFEDEVKWVCVSREGEDCLEWVPKSKSAGKAVYLASADSKESQTSSGIKKIHPGSEEPIGNQESGEEVVSKGDATASIEGALQTAWGVFENMSQNVFHKNVSSSIERAFQSAMGVVENASQHLVQESVSLQNVSDVITDVKKHVEDLKEMLESSLTSVQSSAAQGFKDQIQPAVEEVSKLMGGKVCSSHRKGNGQCKGCRGSGRNDKHKHMSERKGGTSNRNVGFRKCRGENLFNRKYIRKGRLSRKSGVDHSINQKIADHKPVSKRTAKTFKASNVRTPGNEKEEIAEQMSGRRGGFVGSGVSGGKFSNRKNVQEDCASRKAGVDHFTNQKNRGHTTDLHEKVESLRASGVKTPESKREETDMSDKVVLPSQSEELALGERRKTSEERRKVLEEDRHAVEASKEESAEDELSRIKNGAGNNTNIKAEKKREPTVDGLGKISKSERSRPSDGQEKTIKMDKENNTNPPKLNIEKVLNSLDMSCGGEVRCVENHKMDAAKLLKEMIGYRQWLWEQRFRKDVDEVEDFMEELEEFIDEDDVDDEDIEDLKDEFEDMMEDIQKTTKKFFRKQSKKKNDGKAKEQKQGKDKGRAKQERNSQPEQGEKPEYEPGPKPHPELGEDSRRATNGEESQPKNRKKWQQGNLGNKNAASGRNFRSKNALDVEKDNEEEVHTVMLNIQDLPGMQTGNSSLASESDKGTENEGEALEANSLPAVNSGKKGKRPKKEQSGTVYANTDQWFFRRAHDRDLRRGKDPDGAGWYFKRFRVWDDDRRMREKEDWYFERAESRKDERGCTTQPSHCAWAKDESVITVWEMYKWLTERFSIRETLRAWDLDDQINWFLRKP